MSGETEIARIPTFRLATETDSETVLEFMREYYAFDGHRFHPEKTPIALLRLLRDASLGRVWLILDRETPVGYIVLCFGYSLEFLGRDAFIDEFYLREKYRGRGWGAEAMRFVEGAAHSLEVKSLHLEVTRQNKSAKAFYQKFGFQDRKHHLMTKRGQKPLSTSAARPGATPVAYRGGFGDDSDHRLRHSELHFDMRAGRILGGPRRSSEPSNHDPRQNQIRQRKAPHRHRIG